MFYNYKKIFFRFRIGNQSLFGKYLFFAALLILPTTILSNDNINRIQRKAPVWNFHEYIKARFSQQSTEIRMSYVPYLKDGNHNKAVIPEERKVAKEKRKINITQNVNSSLSVVEAKSSDPLLKKYLQTEQAYNENIQNLQIKNDKQFHISQPNFTDFAVIQGYRSYEETVAVGSKSKKVVERCLERYFHYHPRIRGKIIIKFNVHPDGYIIDESLEIVYSDIVYAPTLEAIRKSMLRWVSYPAVPLESGIYSVTQKYIF